MRNRATARTGIVDLFGRTRRGRADFNPVDGDLSGLFWAYALIFLVLGIVIVVAVSVLGGGIYMLIRPPRGRRFVTALAAVWTAATGLLAAQLLRLEINGSITPKGERWLGTAALGVAAGVLALTLLSRKANR